MYVCTVHMYVRMWQQMGKKSTTVSHPQSVRLSRFHCILNVTCCPQSVRLSRFHCILNVTCCPQSVRLSRFHCILNVTCCPQSVRLSRFHQITIKQNANSTHLCPLPNRLRANPTKRPPKTVSENLKRLASGSCVDSLLQWRLGGLL